MLCFQQGRGLLKAGWLDVQPCLPHSIHHADEEALAIARVLLKCAEKVEMITLLQEQVSSNPQLWGVVPQYKQNCSQYMSIMLQISTHSGGEARRGKLKAVVIMERPGGKLAFLPGV